MVAVEKILGLDIGIASLGWSVIDNTNSKIIDYGVRCFTKAEEPKTGESLAAPRRAKRLLRRLIRRKTQRMEKVRELFIKNGLVSESDLESLYKVDTDTKNPWELRYEALNRKLDGKELARVLTHIAKRRGFKSNSKAETEKLRANKTEGKLLSGIEENKSYLEMGYNGETYRTVGEMFFKHPKFQENRRNKAGSYVNTVSRDMLEEEIDIIFEAQKKLGNSLVNEELKSSFKHHAFRQTPIRSVEKMVGYCEFELTEKRAAKKTYSAEIFVLLTKINNLGIVDKFGKERKLSQDDKELIFLEAHKKKEMKFSQMRKWLELNEDERFKSSGLVYSYSKKGEDPIKEAEKKVFAKLDGYHEIKSRIVEKLGENEWNALENNAVALDEIATQFTFQKNDEDITSKLKAAGIKDDIIQALLGISFDKVLNLSLKAMRKIIPYMQQGDLYSVACEKAGYNHSQKENLSRQKFLPVIDNDEIPNPVVRRAVTQARKLVNAIIREHGVPDQINIELARELSKSFQERREIEKGQLEFRKEKESIEKQFEEDFKRKPTAKELLKFRLWKEQGGHCIYSGVYIKPEEILNEGYCDVDHILPYSRSLDDSMNNKVLCLASENREKGNKTPYEYKGETSQWNAICAEAERLKIAKRNKILTKTFDEREEGFRERNLNDTRYISRFLKNYIEQTLQFPQSENKNKVQVRSGSLTATLRTRWGLLKNREQDGDLHHALDAIVVAASTQGMVQRLSQYSTRQETEYLDEHFPSPWEGFRDDVNNCIKTLEEGTQKIVSRAVRKKFRGQGHLETISSPKRISEKKSSVKVALSGIKTKDLALIDNENGRNDNLINQLKTRLEANGDDPKKAFPEGFIYMKNKDGDETTTKVRSVRLWSKQNSFVGVNKDDRGNPRGVADNGDMIRVDVFEKQGKLYLVPIYAHHLVTKILPNRAIVAYKPEDEWTVTDDTYNFKFSLQDNEYIEVITSKGEVSKGYYKGADRATGAITIESHHRKIKAFRPGAKTLKSFKKYSVDYLGNISKEIKKETRLGLEKYNSDRKLPVKAEA